MRRCLSRKTYSFILNAELFLQSMNTRDWRRRCGRRCFFETKLRRLQAETLLRSLLRGIELIKILKKKTFDTKRINYSSIKRQWRVEMKSSDWWAFQGICLNSHYLQWNRVWSVVIQPRSFFAFRASQKRLKHRRFFNWCAIVSPLHSESP